VHYRRDIVQTLITEFISLDGVVQAPGGPKEDTDGGFRHGGWSMKYFDPEVMGATYDELSKRSDALLQGRRTYQVSAQAWPRRSGDAFSDWINSVQKCVVSDTLSETDITWQPTTIIRSVDLLKKVSELRDQPGGYIYVYGQRHDGARPARGRPRRRASPHDRADRSRRRQDDLPRQQGGADFRARFDG
jgi:dihydrofolate reductase